MKAEAGPRRSRHWLASSWTKDAWTQQQLGDSTHVVNLTRLFGIYDDKWSRLGQREFLRELGEVPPSFNRSWARAHLSSVWLVHFAGVWWADSCPESSVAGRMVGEVNDLMDARSLQSWLDGEFYGSFVHGLLWQYLSQCVGHATNPVVFSSTILAIQSAAGKFSNYAAMHFGHGAGHAAFYATARLRHAFTAKFQPHLESITLNRTEAAIALQMCAATQQRAFCINGLYHAILQFQSAPSLSVCDHQSVIVRINCILLYFWKRKVHKTSFAEAF
eukprot:1926737-Prymnesium_polylepis.1